MKDIAFGVYFQPGKLGSEELKPSDEKELVRLGRVNSHIVPEDGSIECKRTGTCKRNGIIWCEDDNVIILYNIYDDPHAVNLKITLAK